MATGGFAANAAQFRAERYRDKGYIAAGTGGGRADWPASATRDRIGAAIPPACHQSGSLTTRRVKPAGCAVCAHKYAAHSRVDDLLIQRRLAAPLDLDVVGDNPTLFVFDQEIPQLACAD
jgi:hypothetical protein